MLSVITPVYNGEKFIEECIKAVINQECSQVEHIIVDGGSNDRTIELVKQYAGDYPHIRWLSEPDRGQSDAMNKGIAIAKGEILGFLNVDDYYEPQVLNRVMEGFKTLPEPSFLVGNCNVWNDAGTLLFVNQPKKLRLTDLLLGDEANHFPINPSAYFYHTSLHQATGLYSENEHYAMDLDFILRAIQIATPHYINVTLGNFRMLEGTKTVNDQQGGQITARKKAIMQHYRKTLSPLQRWYTTIGYEVYEAKRAVKKITRFHHFKSYLQRLMYQTSSIQ
ncbi:MAG: glycosyltransferase [Phormidesmis sp. CAN_BIN44]|nr:glycosyltransferase [Phormidesmis sp. CAN_BIN44]